MSYELTIDPACTELEGQVRPVHPSIESSIRKEVQVKYKGV